MEVQMTTEGVLLAKVQPKREDAMRQAPGLDHRHFLCVSSSDEKIVGIPGARKVENV